MRNTGPIVLRLLAAGASQQQRAGNQFDTGPNRTTVDLLNSSVIKPRDYNEKRPALARSTGPGIA
jgi:hypothetical protein